MVRPSVDLIMILYIQLNYTFRLHSTEQIMPKKSRGRIIHPSEFIEPENGRLVFKLGNDGEVIKEARQIISAQTFIK